MTDADKCQELEERVRFLEETLYNLSALLTGKTPITSLSTLKTAPINPYDMGRALTAMSEMLVGLSVPTCPPWCKAPVGGGGTNAPAAGQPMVRPSIWP